MNPNIQVRVGSTLGSTSNIPVGALVGGSVGAVSSLMLGLPWPFTIVITVASAFAGNWLGSVATLTQATR